MTKFNANHLLKCYPPAAPFLWLLRCLGSFLYSGLILLGAGQRQPKNTQKAVKCSVGYPFSVCGRLFHSIETTV